MRRSLYFLYGMLAYALFLGTFLYAIGFVGNLLVPKSIDSGPAGGTGVALAVDLALLSLFAVQHSGMARPAFKRWWTRIVPEPIERSTYILFANAALIALYVFWRPIPAVVWDVTGSALATATLWALFTVGWLIVLLSTFMIGHWDLFGVRQVWANFRDRLLPDDPFRTPALYAVVRHPIMLGFLIAFWAIPRMTVAHLMFAVVTSAYIVVAVRLEERDLVARFGELYEGYRRRVPAFIPLPRFGATVEPGHTAVRGARASLTDSRDRP